MIRAAVVCFVSAVVLALGIASCAQAAPIDDLRDGYIAGTFLSDDPDYAALYAQTTDRTLVFHRIAEQEGRTAAIYELRFQHASGHYSETGVLVLYHAPVRLEFVPVADLNPTAIDLAVAGQAADIGTTALALSSGFAEGNPVVAGAISTPAGTAAIIALKLAGPSLADNLALPDCVTTRAALASVGWAAATWNVAAIAGAASGVGGLLAILAGWLAADAAQQDAPLRCAGLTEGAGQ